MKFTHNQKVRCTINGVDITDARISINEDGRPYICHNESLADGAAADDKLGYKYSWLLFKDFPEDSVTNLRPALKSFDDPQVGDEYRDRYDNSRWVLGVSGRVIHLSIVDYKDVLGPSFTKEELIKESYTIVQDEEEVTEMTVAEISKALGKTVKVVE